MKQEVKPSLEPMSEQEFQTRVLDALGKIEQRLDKVEKGLRTLLALNGIDEDGGIAPLKLVNLEDPESRKKHGLDW